MEKNNCVFCDIPKERVIAENEHVYAIRDGYPVTELHTLIIPKRHFADYFDIEREELLASQALLDLIKKKILQSDKSVEGFNIGVNSGSVAGQTILHCHIHLIPRRIGDVPNPRGGVRHIIPGKGNY